MITKEQALGAQEFHYTGLRPCSRHIGPRGGVTQHIIVCRRSGATQTWKCDITRFRVPVRYSMWEHSEITQDNAADWHRAQDCPLLADGFTDTEAKAAWLSGTNRQSDQGISGFPK